MINTVEEHYPIFRPKFNFGLKFTASRFAKREHSYFISFKLSFWNIYQCQAIVWCRFKTVFNSSTLVIQL